MTEPNDTMEEWNKRWPEIGWETKREFFFASDRAAVDTGIAGLNAITLLNGGAVVALLAFIAQVWNDTNEQLLKHLIAAGTWFVCGVSMSALSFFAAYFYQSAVTLVANKHLARHFSTPEKMISDLRKPTRWRMALLVIMVGTTFFAVIGFIVGTFLVLGAFSHGDVVKTALYPSSAPQAAPR